MHMCLHMYGSPCPPIYTLQGAPRTNPCVSSGAQRAIGSRRRSASSACPAHRTDRRLSASPALASCP